MKQQEWVQHLLMTQGGWNVARCTFGLNEVNVLHNQSCGLVVGKSLREWQWRREWDEEWCGTKPRMKPSTWMNEQWTTATVCRAHTHTHTNVRMCLDWEHHCEAFQWCSQMRRELLIIVPKYMQSTDWCQFEEWQRHICKYLCLFRWLEEKISLLRP